MSTPRLRRAAAAVLAAGGLGLLAAAYADGSSAPTSPPPGPTAGRDHDPASTPRAGPRRLTTSVPRPPDRAPVPGPVPDEQPAPAATGDPLPAQWPSFRPTRLALRPASGGTAAAVDPVGVVGGALELPGDADRVGWWRGGSRAGAPFGTVVVAGHLDSATDPAGYLAGLAGLGPGDVVELSDDDERQRYRVVRNYLLPSADLSSRSDLFAQQQRHRLLLVTCGGPYDHERGRYRDNRLVEAVPVRR